MKNKYLNRAHISVKLYNASENKKTGFNLFRKSDMSPISYVKVAKSTGDVVEKDEIVRAYEYEKDKHVVVEDEDLEKANQKRSKSIEIINFVDEDEIDSIYYEKPYYLESEEVSVHTYALLVKALEKSKKVGIAKFVLHTREHLAAVIVIDGVLVLNQMKFEEDIVSVPELELNIPEKEKVSKEELDTALQIIEKMTKPFGSNKYKDTFQKVVDKVIQQKVVKKEVVSESEAPSPTQVGDLMGRLKESLKTA